MHISRQEDHERLTHVARTTSKRCSQRQATNSCIGLTSDAQQECSTTRGYPGRSGAQGPRRLPLHGEADGWRACPDSSSLKVQPHRTFDQVAECGAEALALVLPTPPRPDGSSNAASKALVTSLAQGASSPPCQFLKLLCELFSCSHEPASVATWLLHDARHVVRARPPRSRCTQCG